jgi:hypothetical protein
MACLVRAGDQNPTGASASVAGQDGGLVEMLQWRALAQNGDVRAQVSLADAFTARQQPGEAIRWYRQAATNGEVTAQLALAACLIAGRGTTEDRREAAYWMRQAADGVEGGIKSRTNPVPNPNPRPPLIFTRSNSLPVAPKTSATTSALVTPPKNLFTNTHSLSTRVGREDTLAVFEPSLQERSATIQPSPVSK